MTPLLQVEGLTLRFGGLQVLSDVTLQVPDEGVVGVIGPNGAGKTSLFNVICGFVRPNAGRLFFAGHELRGHHPHELTALGIARTLQGLGLFARLSVLDNVLAGATHVSRTGPLSALLAMPRSDRDEKRLRERALAVLDTLGLAGEAHQIAAGLPYGARKRVVLARALVSEPRLLLLDEPASGLRAGEREALAALLAQLKADGLTMMLIEHDVGFVSGLADMITVLDLGTVIAEGPPGQVSRDPAVIAAYIGAGPQTGTEQGHATGH